MPSVSTAVPVLRHVGKTPSTWLSIKRFVDRRCFCGRDCGKGRKGCKDHKTRGVEEGPLLGLLGHIHRLCRHVGYKHSALCVPEDSLGAFEYVQDRQAG